MSIKKAALLLPCIICTHSHAQQHVLQYVNPFIGTTSSGVFTKWGNAGGTYPGAVAPAGCVQLTPETSISGTHGYDYKDSSIYFFSCLNHLSGYPEGSAGRLYIMPVRASMPFELYQYKRPFSHKKETAQAGYYQVIFTDDNTVVEATATQRVGIFRVSFPARTTPKIFVGDVGRVTQQSKQLLYASYYNVALQTSMDIARIDSINGGYMVTFESDGIHQTTVTLALSPSGVGAESAKRNIDKEIGGLGFDTVKNRTQQLWSKLLSVVEIQDTAIAHKAIFYTALYHSLLLPWVISDVDGNYKGDDGKLHHTNSANEYAGFSPWDTYRTLHPLLTLLYQEKQRDVILSMLDIYNQTGYLPAGPMTGNHFIPIIIDAYLKGVKGFDTSLAYAAMKKSIMDGPFTQDDMAVYSQQGYVPCTYPESVTRTVEYAYDDWALSQFAKIVMHNTNDYNKLLQRSTSYRQLFNKDALLTLPRNGDAFKLNPGTSGYKEGDAWVYTFLVQHNPVDLINLLGGGESFSKILDDALATQRTVFDNETVFHVPYLFNYAGHAWLTQKWVRSFMDNRYSATPQGLPGNDDLGSMSAWYVFSSLGFFPACPGSPVYEIGSPIFKSATLHLPNGKQWEIISKNAGKGNICIQSVSINGKKYSRHYLTHALIEAGGEMVFTMGPLPAKGAFTTDVYDTVFATREPVDIQATLFTINKKEVHPNEPFGVHVTLRNNGGRGTHAIKLLVKGVEYANKNSLLEAHAVKDDSISCTLYPVGKTTISIEGLARQSVTVVEEAGKVTPPLVFDMQVKPLVHVGSTQHVSFIVQNISGHTEAFDFPLTANGLAIKKIHVRLGAGEQRNISEDIPAVTKGFVTLIAGSAGALYKVYDSNNETLLFNLLFDSLKGDSLVTDASGFGNHATIVNNTMLQKQNKRVHIDSSCYIALPHNASVDSLGETLTMMAWVHPDTTSLGLIDIFSKGDNHVLQLAGPDKLTFFAGGWGRGDCTVSLPPNWVHHWHHVAGVCTGDTLHVYIDGDLCGTSVVDGHPSLTVQSQWQIGRNEEFPGQRIFTGYVDKAKVFGAVLAAREIKEMVERERGIFLKN
jgi:putative alpha-1,2-mannosidase